MIEREKGEREKGKEIEGEKGEREMSVAFLMRSWNGGRISNAFVRSNNTATVQSGPYTA